VYLPCLREWCVCARMWWCEGERATRLSEEEERRAAFRVGCCSSIFILYIYIYI
jgi:hypothetical protein